MNQPYNKKNYYLLALDPIHVGTGGYQLGRVDNSIIREPGTNLPKIPGSSIAGVARAYTAMTIQNENYTDIGPDFKIDYKKYQNWKYRKPRYRFVEEQGHIKIDDGKATVIFQTDGKPSLVNKDGREAYYSCAGKGVEDGEGHCGQPDCPVCVSFGFSKGSSHSSFQGLAQFSDAQILFFPVHTMVGSTLVTCPSILESACIQASDKLGDMEWTQFNRQLSQKKEEYFYTLSSQIGDYLNLGWLYLPKKNVETGATYISNLKNCLDNLLKNLKKLANPNKVLETMVIVSDKLFPRIVNDNLEVRTSIAIDPATGAVEEKALFTYEAIPMATIMRFDVVYSKPEYFAIKVPSADKNGFDEQPIQHGKFNGNGWEWVCENVEKGLGLIEHLGIGGMNTRGMGRFRILNGED